MTQKFHPAKKKNKDFVLKINENKFSYFCIPLLN